MNDTNHFHGSDIEVLEQKYKLDRDSMMNFSGNVNPLGISKQVKQVLKRNIDLIASYPDRGYVNLRTSIATYTDTCIDNIIVGNGSTELISLSINLINPNKALIIGPTYSEYEKEVVLSGGIPIYYELQENLDFELDIQDLLDSLTDDIDLLVMCNPNNPTSTAIKNSDINIILDYCKKNDIYVIIDETYVEFVTNINDISAVNLTKVFDNLIVLRGVSKFFSAPGLRLGYCICSNNHLLEKINKNKNPWSINALASLAGEVMLNDIEYINNTNNLIGQERDKIYNILKQWNEIKVYKPRANFILVKLLNSSSSHELFEHLIKENIIIRDVSNFMFLDSKFFRFCFLLPEQNNRLINKLDNLIRLNSN